MDKSKVDFMKKVRGLVPPSFKKKDPGDKKVFGKKNLAAVKEMK